MAENHNETKADNEIVPIYCLTTLTQAEQASLLDALEKEHDDEENAEPLDFVKPRLVPWTGEGDGDMGDMYRLYRELIKGPDEREATYESFFFVDRACLSPADKGGEGETETKIILAQPDGYTLQFSPEAAAEMQALLRVHGTGVVPQWDEGLAELLEPEMLRRALTYGRIPVSHWRPAYANLDIANMGMGELVEFGGGQVERVDDPEWDAKWFVGRVEEVYRERREKGEGNAL